MQTFSTMDDVKQFMLHMAAACEPVSAYFAGKFRWFGKMQYTTPGEYFGELGSFLNGLLEIDAFSEHHEDFQSLINAIGFSVHTPNHRASSDSVPSWLERNGIETFSNTDDIRRFMAKISMECAPVSRYFAREFQWFSEINYTVSGSHYDLLKQFIDGLLAVGAFPAHHTDFRHLMDSIGTAFDQ